MTPPTAEQERLRSYGSSDDRHWVSPVPSNPAMSSSSPFSFAVSRALGTVVVTVHGILDSAGAAELEDVLRDLITDQGNLYVVVDLRKLAGMDLACVAVFVSAWEWARRRGGKFALYNPPPATTAAIREAGLPPDLFDVGDIEAGRSSMEAPWAGNGDDHALQAVSVGQAFEPRAEHQASAGNRSELSGLLQGLPACPRCQGTELGVRSEDELTVFDCVDCSARWHIELGYLCLLPVIPLREAPLRSASVPLQSRSQRRTAAPLQARASHTGGESQR